MYVVAGATGQTGGAVASWLLNGGHNITVLARSKEKGQSWKEKGAAVAVAELHEAKQLRSVLADAEGAYLLVPPNYTSEHFLEHARRVAESVAEAVTGSGVPHVVFLSSIGSQHASGTGLIGSTHIAEEILQRAANALTIVRASFFTENWAPLLPVVSQSGTLPSFLTPDRKIGMVATADIGRVSAESLLNPTIGRRIIELTGPGEYSPNDIAGLLAGLLNREVHVAHVPTSAAIPTFTGMGFTEGVARGFGEMYDGINSGLVAFEGTGTELHRGEITPEQVLAGLIGYVPRV